MSTISFSLSDWNKICHALDIDADEVMRVLANGDLIVSNEPNLLTAQEETELKEWGERRRFDQIALFLGGKIYEICPFYTRAGYNDILIGTPDSGVQNTGYLGWNVFSRMPKSSLSVKEIRQLIKNPMIQKKLKRISRRAQQYLIKPMMNIMFEKGVNEATGTKDDIYQHQMNRYLNLDKLDPTKELPQGMIVAELYQRLCTQGIMKKIHRKVTGVRGSAFHIKKKPTMDYRPALFQMPTGLGLSGGEQATLQILEQLVKTETFFKGNEWKIRVQHINPFKHGFPGWMKYDFALWKNDHLWGLIEFDGIQHHRCVQLWHDKEKKGRKSAIEKFLAQHLKDRIKDADALKLCNSKKCLRVGPRYKGAFAQENIKKKIINWLTL